MEDQAQAPAVAPGVLRAALAFSAFPSYQAEKISSRLPARDRSRLRSGLAHIHQATSDDRRAALRLLVRATHDGPDWTVPAVHDAADCPFRCIDRYSRAEVIKALELIAAHRPLHIAVAMSHIEEPLRSNLWRQMSPEARGDVIIHVAEVPNVSVGRTRAFARELKATLELE